MKNGFPKIAFMQGNEACAEGAIFAGCRFFAGYPITPSSEIAEYLSVYLPRVGGVFIQMEDEIASMGAVIGASLTGLKAMTATSGPGFSLKQENLGFAVMGEIPVVVVNVMRGGPSTGLPTMPSQMDVMQARWGTHGDHQIIAIAPATVQEIFDEIIRAFNLAERFRNPVVFLMDEINGHMREKLVIPDPEKVELVYRKTPREPVDKYEPYKVDNNTLIPGLPKYGSGYRFHITGLSHDETGFPTNDPVKIEQLIKRLNEKILNFKHEIIKNKTYYLDDAKIAIFAYGSTARSALGAVKRAREKNIPVGLFQPLTLWPFPEEDIRDLAKQVDVIIVAELNYGQMYFEVARNACCQTKIEKVNLYNGKAMPPSMIYNKIMEVYNV